MALRAEIAVIDDDENIVGIVKVPLFKRDERTFDHGPFAQNMVTDPATGEVYKFTFQADAVGQIAPKREESTFPKKGDFVRIIGTGNPLHHRLPVGELAEVIDVDSNGDVRAEGAGIFGKTITQFVSHADYILE